MEVVDQVGALDVALVQAVSFKALHHSHLQLAALVEMLGVDHRPRQIGERGAEKRSDNIYSILGHPDENKINNHD